MELSEEPKAEKPEPRVWSRTAPISLTTGPQWNGWGRDAAQSRYQPTPGIAAADVPKLKLKWAFAYAGSRNGRCSSQEHQPPTQRALWGLLRIRSINVSRDSSHVHSLLW